MKHIGYITLFFCIIFFSCNTEKKKITTDIVRNPLSADEDYIVPMPEIYMEEEDFDFGDILEGDLVTHDFLIKNVGNDKLLISSVKGSCGCTVAEYPKDPIFPGEETYIRVSFNTLNRIGKQNKLITLVTNAIPNIKVIKINANVKVPKK